jgi:hypothetical protein
MDDSEIRCQVKAFFTEYTYGCSGFLDTRSRDVSVFRQLSRLTKNTLSINEKFPTVLTFNRMAK